MDAAAASCTAATAAAWSTPLLHALRCRLAGVPGFASFLVPILVCGGLWYLRVLEIAFVSPAENARRAAATYIFDRGGALLLWSAALVLTQYPLSDLDEAGLLGPHPTT